MTASHTTGHAQAFGGAPGHGHAQPRRQRCSNPRCGHELWGPVEQIDGLDVETKLVRCARDHDVPHTIAERPGRTDPPRWPFDHNAAVLDADAHGIALTETALDDRLAAAAGPLVATDRGAETPTRNRPPIDHDLGHVRERADAVFLRHRRIRAGAGPRD